MILLIVLGLVLAFLVMTAAIGSVWIRAQRDRRNLPAQGWSPLPGQVWKQQTVDAETIRYADVEGGSPAAPTLVFLHGIGASSYVWRDLISLLSPRFRLMLVDLPGFGMSSKNPDRRYDLDEQTETMARFLDALEIQKPILVGSSMGGAIALWMAKQNPDRFEAIVAISPATNGARYWFPLFVPSFFMRSISFLGTRFLFRLIMKNVIESHHRIDESLIDEYWRPFATDPESVVTVLKGLRIVHDARLPYQLQGLSERLPICILWGAKDHLTPVRDHKLLSLYLPSAKFEMHETAGHHVMEDAPGWCAEKIQDFLTVEVPNFKK